MIPFPQVQRLCRLQPWSAGHGIGLSTTFNRLCAYSSSLSTSFQRRSAKRVCQAKKAIMPSITSACQALDPECDARSSQASEEVAGNSHPQRLSHYTCESRPVTSSSVFSGRMRIAGWNRRPGISSLSQAGLQRSIQRGQQASRLWTRAQPLRQQRQQTPSLLFFSHQ